MLPLDTTVQAEYEDGFVLDETQHDDAPQFGDDGNIFTDILQKRAETQHGRMVRFSCFWKDQRYDVDWTDLPDNARPIRFRHGYYTRSLDGSYEEKGWSGVDFGYQYNDEDGANHKEVLELR